LGPVLERQVGGHHENGPLIRPGDLVEQQFRPGLTGGNVAEFVEDQPVELGELLPLPQSRELTFFFRLDRPRSKRLRPAWFGL
jgi:hypothetical protein